MPDPSLPSPEQPRAPAVRAALRITVIYLIVGFIWIIASDALLAVLASGGTKGLITELQTIKGWLFVLMTGAVLFLVVRSYVTTLQAAERRLRSELEERVKARTADLSRANEQLKADAEERSRIEAQLRAATQEAQHASHAKSAFLANTSHEVRTPLTSILGYTDLLLDSDLPSEERQRHIQVIQQNAAHLLTLIDDLLDLSRTEIGKLNINMADYSPREVAEQTVDLLRPRADEKRLPLALHVDPAVPDTIRTDGVRLRQVLTNLVSNAIKFTSSGQVTVNVRREEKPEPVVCFDVIDTGIGIGPDHIGRIYEPFFQVEQGTGKRYGGSGLGLPISRQLTEQMGGNLQVRSEAGKGSTFTVRIPISTAAVPSIERVQRTSEKVMLSGHILLTEDNANVRWLVEEYLKRAGATVTAVADGQESVNAVQAAVADPSKPAIDLILMDIHMPGMDGFEAMRQIRAAQYRGPIVAMTAHLMAHEKERCNAAGCNAIVPKPIDVQTFIPLISRLMTEKAATTGH